MGIFQSIRDGLFGTKKRIVITTAAVLLAAAFIKEQVDRSAPLDNPTKQEMFVALKKAVSVEDIMKVSDEVLSSTNSDMRTLNDVIDKIKITLMGLHSLRFEELIRQGILQSGDEPKLDIIREGLKGRLNLLEQKKMQIITTKSV